MQILETASILIAGSSERPNIGASIANIGCPGFSAAFLNYLRSICDAEHFALYYIDDAEMRDVAAGGVRLDGVAETQAKTYANGGFWRYDPGLDSLWEREADGRPVIVHMDIDEICHDELRERIYRPFCVRERVVLSARRAGSAVSISLIRTQKSGPFSADGLMRLNNVVEAVMSMAIRHTDMIRCSAQTRLGLTSLPVIEARLSSATPALARREAEVCARILYGMTSLGISLDLGIAEESAMTYRKRAYSRLKIGSQRELLLWYLDHWSCQKTEFAMSRLQ